MKFMLNHFLIDFYTLREQQRDTVNFEDLLQHNPNVPTIRWSHEDSYILNEKGVYNSDLDSVFADHPPPSGSERVAFMIRDPRDVAVSYFHQVTKRSTNPLEITSIDDFVLDPILGIRRVLAYYRRYQRYSHKFKEFKLLRYETALEDTEKTLTELLEFIGVRSPPPKLVRQAVIAGQPDAMRRRERSGDISGMRTFSLDNPNALKVRKAKSGTHVEELSSQSIDECVVLMHEFNDPFSYLCEE